jgi:hypothetical protein
MLLLPTAGMAVSRDTTDMLYKATVAYSQLYLLYKSAEWSGGGSGQFSSEIDSSLKRCEYYLRIAVCTFINTHE